MITENPINILIRRRAAMGDVIMITPVVRALHQKYKGHCNIDVQTDFSMVFDNNPYIRKCYPTTTDINPTYSYNQFYNLDDTYENNPTTHFVDTYMYTVFGDEAEQYAKNLEIYGTQKEAAIAYDILEKINGEFIIVHARQWHWEMKNIDQSVWINIFEGLFSQRTDHKIVFVGGPTDWAIDHPLMIDARGIPLAATSQLMNAAKCFVGIDSAPFHIAGSSHVPIVALLSHLNPGSILPYRQGIKGYNCTVVQASVPCVGCYEKQARPVRGINCIPGGFPCNKEWNIPRILAAINSYI